MKSCIISGSRLKSRVSAIALLSTLAISALPFSSQAEGAFTSSRLAQQPNPPVKLDRLPPRIAHAVLRAHARQMQVPVRSLQVAAASRETWTDSCLGVQKPYETCAVVMTNGWRIEVSDGTQSWFYRTDATGTTIVKEDVDNVGTLPQAIAQKVLMTAAKASGVSVRQLKIATTRSMVWDGCLGVAGANQACTMIGIPGWQVVVSSPEQYWVYHLNQTASQIKLNPTTSGKGSIIPTFWEPDPQWLGNSGNDDVIFQSITSGGFAGLTYKTVLQKDGQVVRISMRGNTASTPTVIRRLSSQQVQQFMQTLQQQEFGDFIGFNYPVTNAADYFTIALMLPGGNQAVQYADIVQDQTPTKLQQTIAAWNRLTQPKSP